jgi:serine/threonine protein phosphatase 1
LFLPAVESTSGEIMHWIIGDIHGMLAPRETLLIAIAKRDSAAELFFVGDYVNRGPDSRRVIDLLLIQRRCHFIRGNHDDAFDIVINGKAHTRHEMLRTRAFALRNFLNFGMDATLQSYGIPRSEISKIAQNPKESVLDDLAKRIPAAHREFLASLKLYSITDDFFVTHAKLPPDVSLNHIEQHRDTLIWGRFTGEDLGAKKEWDRRGYFGHTAVQNYSGLSLPIVGMSIVLVDTGAVLYDDGRLTAYCHEDNSFLQVDPHGRLA